MYVRRDSHQDFHVTAKVFHFRYRYLDPLLQCRLTPLTPMYETLSMHCSSFNSLLSLAVIVVVVVIVLVISPFIAIYRAITFYNHRKIKMFYFFIHENTTRLINVDVRV